MGTKLKVCEDCGRRKMIGRSKNRCKSCRVTDPDKFLNKPAGSSMNRKQKKSKSKWRAEPFVGWRICYLPKCVYPRNKEYSTINLGKRQRGFVLEAYGFKTYAAYLKSELWASIRIKVLKNAICVCGCGQSANQVHHKVYSEANLMGATLRGLVAINHDCHYEIEFFDKRKVSLGEANHELKERQYQSVAECSPPTENEIKVFLSGKHKSLSEERKLVVRKYLKQKKSVENATSMSIG